MTATGTSSTWTRCLGASVVAGRQRLAWSLPVSAQRTLLEHLVVAAWGSTHGTALADVARAVPGSAVSVATLLHLVVAVLLAARGSSLPALADELSPRALLDPSVWTGHVPVESLVLAAARCLRFAAVRLLGWCVQWSPAAGTAAGGGALVVLSAAAAPPREQGWHAMMVPGPPSARRSHEGARHG
jgi:hypothetical protein